MNKTRTATCPALAQIAEEFHADIQDHCAGCARTGGPCIVECAVALMHQKTAAVVVH